MTQNRVSAWLGLVLLALTTGLMAQTVKRDTVWQKYYAPPVTVTANRYEQSAFEARIPVQVLRQRDIVTQGIATVGQLLASQPGLDLSATGPWSEKPLIRGLSGSQILTLIDGLRLNVLRDYGQHAPLLDADQIDRVEVIRGPASVQYGSDAIGGVVNLITPLPRLSEGGWHWHAASGLTAASANAQFTQTAQLEAASNRAGISVRYQHRRADDIDTPQGVMPNTAFQGQGLDVKGLWQPNRHHRFTLSSQIQRLDDVGVPTSPYATTAHFTDYDRTLTVATYEYINPQSRLVGAHLKVYGQQEDRRFSAVLDGIPKGPNTVHNVLQAHREAATAGFQSQGRLMLGPTHLLVFGVDGYQETDDSHRVADAEVRNASGTVVANPPADNTPPTPQAWRRGIGGFVEDEFTRGRFTLMMGLRYDLAVSHADGTPGTLVTENLEKQDHDLSGNLGLLYRLSPNLRLVAHVGRAFSAPTLQERFFKGTAQVGYLTGNPDLASEHSRHMDLALRWQHEATQGEVAVFHNRIDDYIVMAPQTATADTFLYENVGRAVLWGGEALCRWTPDVWLETEISAAYVHAQDANTDTPLYQTPPLRLRAGLKLQNTKQTAWGTLKVVYSGLQDRVADNEAPSEAYTLLHAGLGLNLDAWLDLGFQTLLTLNVHNVLNTAYRDHLAAVRWWDAPGRNVVLGLKLAM